MRRGWWRRMVGQSIRQQTATASRRRMWRFALRTCGPDCYWQPTPLPEPWSLKSPGAVEAEPGVAVDIRAEERLAERLAGRAAQVAQAAAVREAHPEARQEPVGLLAAAKEEPPVAERAEGRGPSIRHIAITTTIRIPPQDRS